MENNETLKSYTFEEIRDLTEVFMFYFQMNVDAPEKQTKIMYLLSRVLFVDASCRLQRKIGDNYDDEEVACINLLFDDYCLKKLVDDGERRTELVKLRDKISDMVNIHNSLAT